MNLDIAAIRTFVAAVDLQGFARAARKLHRSPGAISLQLKSLEERVGCELFQKSGRQQMLTPAGEVLLGYARRLLQINDEAYLAMGGLARGGEVSFGMPQDFAQTLLPQTLARFAGAHPAVSIGIKVGRSLELTQAVVAGDLDLALAFGVSTADSAPAVGQLAVRWFANPDVSWRRHDAVPLLILDQPCTFRQAAIEALDQANIPWRIAMSSGSVSAVWAAAEAGLGVTARTQLNAPTSVSDVGDALGLPSMSPVSIFLLKSNAAINLTADHLELVIREALGELIA